VNYSAKATKAYIENELEKFKSESLTLAQRMTEGELTEVAKAENKTLIIESIMSVVRLLNTWMKVVQGEIK
jgi:acyl-CoA thioesterase FadM